MTWGEILLAALVTCLPWELLVLEIIYVCVHVISER